MSSAKSLVKVFEAQEDETGQQPSDSGVSQNSRNEDETGQQPSDIGVSQNSCNKDETGQQPSDSGVSQNSCNEDETGQQPSNIDVSQNSRKRPLSNGSRRGSNLLDVKVQLSSVENEKYRRAQ